MGGREAHIGEHVCFGFVQQSSQLRHLGPDLIGDMTPLLACSLGVVLGEGGGHEGGDHAPTLLAGMGKDIAHEVHAAALPGRAPHLGDRRLDTFMAVGDDQFYAAQAAAGELAQERMNGWMRPRTV
jgi:hypothetical protein